MLKNKLSIVCGLIFFIFVLTGCGSGTGDEKAGSAPSEEAEEVEKAPEEQQETAAEKVNEDDEVQEDSQTEQRLEGEGTENLSEESGEQRSEESEEVPQLGDYNVFLGGEMIETEDKIIINGKSNLLPGSRVIGEVTVGEDEYAADTSELVQDDGSFHMEIAHHNLDKETNVAVRFHFDGQQKDEIKRHYGDRGQKLEGPYIYKHQRAAGGRSPQDIFQQAKVETSFEPGEELAVRQFKEPEWYPIPKDMGDPRVWIEVDEINDDKEYYYLHGRSNLIEGSEIRGSFHNNRDKTRVLPDGSFNLKIEYEYREDTPFVIEFRPHDFQWNNVEEAYGKEGQKLVGDLVVTNKYNNYQTIEKEVGIESNEINVPDNVELEIKGTEVTMIVPDNLLFDFDKYDLKGDAKNTLTEISKTLDSFDKDIEIVINGHTDNVGDKQYNQQLSEKRADEVKSFLEKQGDLKDVTFNTKGYGETKPFVSNDSEKGQAKNRRVEIVINLR